MRMRQPTERVRGYKMNNLTNESKISIDVNPIGNVNANIGVGDLAELINTGTHTLLRWTPNNGDLLIKTDVWEKMGSLLEMTIPAQPDVDYWSYGIHTNDDSEVKEIILMGVTPQTDIDNGGQKHYGSIKVED